MDLESMDISEPSKIKVQSLYETSRLEWDPLAFSFRIGTDGRLEILLAREKSPYKKKEEKVSQNTTNMCTHLEKDPRTFISKTRER